MKKLKKLLSAALAAALALTAISGITVSAAGRVTANDIKELAEVTLREEPDYKAILGTAYIPEDGDITSTAIYGDIIDPSSAFLVYSSAECYTRLIGNGADTLSEAIGLCENGANSGTRYDSSGDRCYYQPLPDYPNCADYPQLSGAAAYRLRIRDGEHVELAVQPLYNFAAEYQKVADVMNEYGLDKPDAVYLFSGNPSFGGPLKSASFGVSVDGEEYIIPVGRDINDKQGGAGLEAYRLYDMIDYNAYFNTHRASVEDILKTAESERLERLPGVRTREDIEDAAKTVGTNDTDSFSKYIGTAPHYSDITAGQAAVTNQLTELGVISGFGGKFCPSDNVTRAETAAMLCRLFDIKDGNEGPAAFSDVPQDHWAADCIGALAQKGVISGLGNGTFEPEQSVTYEQVFKMVEQLLGYTGQMLVSYGGTYPEANVLAAVKLGLANDLKSYDSADPISRIELACVLSRALDAHTATVEVYIENLTEGVYYYTDATLSDLKCGAEPAGKLCESDNEFWEYTRALKSEYAEKTRDIIDAAVSQTGGMGIDLGGGITIRANPKADIPRITS